MICADSVIKSEGDGEVIIDKEALIHLKVTIIARHGRNVEIGSKAVVEEFSTIENSSVGAECLIEVGSQLYDSKLGASTCIGPKCKLSTCQIGSGVIVAPGITLENVVVPDDTSVYIIPGGEGRWMCRPVDSTIIRPSVDAYRSKLTNADSSQNLAHNFSRYEEK
mmetsp:Transcript_17358/g.29344  ORF Transcript_17358/g.29344 Transcript_17358/m.29344 type:complete len:165 (-) Transcript_17358:1681-2175(-)